MCIKTAINVQYNKSIAATNATKELNHLSAHTQDAQVWIIQFYLQITPNPPLPCKCSPEGATINWGSMNLIAAYYSFVDPERMKD